MARASGKVCKIQDSGYAWSEALSRREDDEFEGEKWPGLDEAWQVSERARENRECAAIRGELNARGNGKDREKVRAQWLDKVRGISDYWLCI